MIHYTMDIVENADQSFTAVLLKYNLETEVAEIVETKHVDDRLFAKTFLNSKHAMKFLFKLDGEKS